MRAVKQSAGDRVPGNIPASREDPWQHRSVGMRCRTCIFFVSKPVVPKYHGVPIPQFAEHGTVGRCRRHAPSMSGYPVVFETDWCGDHKLDEAKI